MKRNYFLLIITVIFLLIQSCKDNTTAPVVISSDTLLKRFNSIIDTIDKSNKFPGLVVGIWMPDKNIAFKRVKGYSDIKLKTEMKVSDNFGVASITKTFTATLIMQFVEDDKLKLSDKISMYLDKSLVDSLNSLQGFNYGKDITIAQLLNHTSGIADFEDNDFIKYVLANPTVNWQPVETIQWAFRHSSPVFPPDRGWSYSNTNYNLLGMIIEKISGKKYEIVLSENILSKLNTQSTYLSDYNQKIGNKASGYLFDSTDVTNLNISWAWATGGLVSNLDDIYSFLYSFTQAKLFKKISTLNDMMTVFQVTNVRGYGFGIEYLKVGSFDLFGHSGSGLGYTCYMYFVPSRNAYVIAFCNQSDNYTIIEALKAVLSAIS